LHCEDIKNVHRFVIPYYAGLKFGFIVFDVMIHNIKRAENYVADGRDYER